MKFSRTYIVGNGVMGQLLKQRIERFYGPVKVFDIGDEIEIEEVAGEINHVIIATPISVIPQIIQKLYSMRLDRTYVSEIGSVKGDLCRKYAALSHGSDAYKSVHPMVGPLAGDWDILDWNKNCIIISDDISGDIDLDNHPIARFWRDLGFKTTKINAITHDEVIGKLSHLSHYMIKAYVEYIENTMTPEQIALAGTSFEKFRKMAEGAKRLQDIYDSNESLPAIVKDFAFYMEK
jgi:prephenate dehydrogenase